MADICIVCNNKIGLWDAPVPVISQGEKKVVHHECHNKFLADPEKYGGLPEEIKASAVLKASKEQTKAVKLTTTPTYPNLEIEEVKGVITSECVFGMNIFRDFFAGMTDFFGGRSEASQKILRDARETCLNELKKEAYDLGADGVIGIDLDYQEISGKGKGMLFLVASGTAVKFKEETE